MIALRTYMLNMSLFVVSMGLASCKSQLSSKMSFRSTCQKQPHLEKCKSGDADLEASGDEFTVTFTKPLVPNTLTVTGGSMTGMILSLPAGTYDKTLTLKVGYKATSALTLQYWQELFGFSVPSSKSVRLEGSTAPLKPVVLSLPKTIYSSLSAAELMVAKLKTVSIGDDSQVSWTDNKDLTRDDSKLSGKLTQWGQVSVVSDLTPPTVIVASNAAADVTAAFSVNFTASEALQSFDDSHITLVNATLSSFTKNPTDSLVYTANVLPIADGPVSIAIRVGAVKDLFGNTNQVSSTISRIYDVNAPAPGSSGVITSASVDYTSMTLNWTAATDSVTSQANLQYEVRRSTSNNISTLANAEANGTIVTAYSSNMVTTNLTGLIPTTTYYFTVIVKDEAGQKAVYSTLTQATTSDAVAPAPGSSGTITSASVTGGGLTLNWTAGTDAVTAAADLEYYVCRGPSTAAIDTVSECETVGGGVSQQMNWTANTVTSVVTGLTPVTTYYFNVLVRDAGGNKSFYSPLTQATAADTFAAAPGNSGTITTTSVDASALTLNWTTATDDVTAGGSLQYEVRQSASNSMDSVANAEANGVVISAYQAGTTIFAVTGLSPSTTYYFNVIVRDAAGNKAIYTTKSQATTADLTAPTAGTISTSTSLGTSGLTLNWTAGSDAVTAGSSLSYYVCSGPSAAAVDTVAECEAETQRMNWTTAVLTRQISGLTPGTTYYFNVLVRDSAGNKSFYPGKTETTLSGVSTTTNAEKSGNTRHSFYDTVTSKHWQLYQDGSTIKLRYSANGTTWAAANTESITTSKFTIHYKAISGTGYVFLVTEENTYDIVLRRGTVGATSIVFESPVTVYDGSSATDLYRNPAVTSDDTNLWIGGSYYNGSSWTTRVIESTNAADASLVSWNTVSTLGSGSAAPKDLALMPRGGGDLYALYQDGSAVIGYAYASGAWSLASTGGDNAWFSLAGAAGVNGQVSALAMLGGDIFVGGSFADAGGNLSADYVAKFDGTTWSALGSGLNGSVTVLVINGSEIYVGGEFTNAGGNSSADFVAKFDGNSWSALGSGLNSTVYSLAINGSDVYVGGIFTDAGGNTGADSIAKFNGNTWSALGPGLNNSVNALAITGSVIYAGGDFTDAGGNTSADFIARFDGSNWTALGLGLSSSVSAISVNGNDIYIGGYFTDAGGNTNADYIVKFNAGTWTALGAGLNSPVNAIAQNGGDIYVGGFFTDAGGNTSASKIAKFDGTNWSGLGSGTYNPVYALALAGSSIYAGGTFADIGGNQDADYIAKFNGTTWTALGSGLNMPIRALAIAANNVYVGGQFTNAGGNTSADYIAKFDGTTWTALGGGLNASVRAIAISGTNVYVGGEFTNAGGNASADHIAKFDGTTWSSLGPGLGGVVFALAISGSDIYAGGWFSNAGGNASADRIAKFNGSTWSALGPGINGSAFDEVSAIAVNGTDIYVGGNFLNVGGNASADNIAKFNGTTWSALGSGLNSRVYALNVDGSNVYAGGSFTNAGGNAGASCIAKYNGTTWTALGSGLNSDVYSMVVSGGDIYVGGYFTDAGGNVGADYVARWNGSSWQALSPGPEAGSSTIASSLIVSDGHIYAGYESGGLAQFKPAISDAVTSFSASVNDALDPMLLYTDYAGVLKFKKYSGGTWSAASTVHSAPTSGPVLSWVSGLDDLIAFYFNGGAFTYKRFDGSSWGSATTLMNADAGARYPTCDLSSGGGLIKCSVTSQTTSPFDIMNLTVTP